MGTEIGPQSKTITLRMCHITDTLVLSKDFLTTLRPDMSPNTTFALDTLDDGFDLQGPAYASLEAVNSLYFNFNSSS